MNHSIAENQKDQPACLNKKRDITSFFSKSVSPLLRLERMSPQDERFLLAAGGASSVFPSKTEDRDNIRVGLELADAAYKWGDEARAQAISETCSAAKVRSCPQAHLSLALSPSLNIFLSPRKGGPGHGGC